MSSSQSGERTMFFTREKKWYVQSEYRTMFLHLWGKWHVQSEVTEVCELRAKIPAFYRRLQLAASGACRGRTVVRCAANTPTSVVWSWCFIDCFAPASALKGWGRHGYSPFINPTALSCWWASIREKQPSEVVIALVMWLCACVKYWPGRALVYVCPLFLVGTIFRVILLM